MEGAKDFISFINKSPSPYHEGAVREGRQRSGVFIFPSRVSGRGYKIGPVCLCVCAPVCLCVCLSFSALTVEPVDV